MDFGYAEGEIPTFAQWQAMRVIIENSPETHKATKQLKAIAEIMNKYMEGFIIEVEAIEIIEHILLGCDV